MDISKDLIRLLEKIIKKQDGRRKTFSKNGLQESLWVQYLMSCGLDRPKFDVVVLCVFQMI